MPREAQWRNNKASTCSEVDLQWVSLKLQPEHSGMITEVAPIEQGSGVWPPNPRDFRWLLSAPACFGTSSSNSTGLFWPDTC